MVMGGALWEAIIGQSVGSNDGFGPYTFYLIETQERYQVCSRCGQFVFQLPIKHLKICFKVANFFLKSFCNACSAK